MSPRSSLLAAGLALCAIAGTMPARAARPIVDLHRLDASFALFARDTNVPWKTSSVRLDTYSSAPVDFAAYQVDPADVIVAGSNARPRVVDTRSRKAVVRWRFTPPGGYRFQSNDVDVPLGSREGFFVVEARRGNVGEQVWINRTRIGLVTKETPAGIVVYAADLGNGKALARMRVSFVANSRFVDRYTDAHGLVRWTERQRPIFALAQWASSSAFVSFLPQAPLPGTIVGLTLASSEIRAGDPLKVVGFARTRSGNAVRASSGEAHIMVRLRGTLVAQRSVRLDRAGAFAADLPIADSAEAGDYTVLASVNGGTAGANVRVNANPGGLTLNVAAACEPSCRGEDDVPIVVRATRGGAPVPNLDVNVDVVRSPHAYPFDEKNVPWGLTEWTNVTVRTDGAGRAQALVPHPTDGLASTYGVRATGGNATADTRVVAASSDVALRVQADRDEQSAGPLGFDVYATHLANGTPRGSLAVRVQLVHGASIQEQTLTLDARGHARGVFTRPDVGSNLLIARASVDGDAMDAQQVQVEPQSSAAVAASGDVQIALDRANYAPGSPVQIDASASGAQGDALLTYERPTGTDARVVSASGGRARASLRASNAPGALQVGAAFVRDGAIHWSALPLAVDGPGRPQLLSLKTDKDAYAPGDTAHVVLGADDRDGTLVVRVTRGTPSGAAQFESVPQLLAAASTTTQVTAPEFAAWHPWVDSTGSRSELAPFTRRTAQPVELTMAQTQTQNVEWRVERESKAKIDVTVPATAGRYLVSILKIDDDGRVSAASGELEVR